MRWRRLLRQKLQLDLFRSTQHTKTLQYMMIKDSLCCYVGDSDV